MPKGRFPEVEVVRSTKESVVIPKHDKIFVVHGIPRIIKTNNGSPFIASVRYVETLGTKLEFSTPLWRQSNAEAERFIQVLGAGGVENSKHTTTTLEAGTGSFLATLYRSSPHCATGVPPAEI
ncbi:PREDICTED: uncharacterized protein K02A2.6-like [Paramuricea clavata]|uniref:PREDICTED: uncharacterized protein K02A2.6-like n=1 Tax=Paramuricea clavata TaxID=317549 RepID=A0A6S7HTC0_PARCT|nr:PREDICTED: uncharacterized protein K02A2.6-like [Paramuricea clavata]